MNEKHQKITEIVTMFAELVDKKLSDVLLKMYIKILEPYPLEKIQAAAERLLKTKTFNKFPLPAEFLQYIDPPEDKDARAVVALDLVFDKMDVKGGNYSVNFDDPVIHRVIHHLGGWIAFCDSTRELSRDIDWRFWRKQFTDAYKLLQHSKRETPRLVGRFEAENRFNGYLTDDNMLLLPDGSHQPADFIEEPTHPQIEMNNTDFKRLNAPEVEK